MNATDNSDDEMSPAFEEVVDELHSQRERACRLDRMRHAVQTGDKMREMSLWDDDLVYGDDMRQGGVQIGFAYLLEKHAFAKKNIGSMHLRIMDTSDVQRPAHFASAEAAAQDSIFKFRVDYNGLTSFGTGRIRREAREMASLQMLRLLYPGPWTFGALCDFWIPPMAPPDPWKQEMGREERSAKSARKDPPSSVYR